MRDVARKHAVDAHLDTRMLFTKFGKGGEESVNGTFVHTHGEFAALQSLEFGESFFDFIAQVNQALGIVLQKGSRIGEANGARATNEERLAKRVLEFADSKADGGLGTVEALASARKAAFFRDHEEYLQFAEVQGKLLAASIRRNYQM